MISTTPSLPSRSLIMGIGRCGLFGSPNIASIINAVPPEATGSRIGHAVDPAEQRHGRLDGTLLYHRHREPHAPLSCPELATSLTSAGAPGLIAPMSAIPPTGALFAAFLGYNPVHTILVSLPATTVAAIGPPATIAVLDRHHMVPDHACERLDPLAAISSTSAPCSPSSRRSLPQ